jgi:4-hydroxy-tetrahydrodipicolinate reductase
MDTIIFGDGGLGRAIAAALIERRVPVVRLLGRPACGVHDPSKLPRADLAFEASRCEAVVPNLEAALGAGVRSVVIATTGWEADRATVVELLRDRQAAAVAAPNLSLGMALFARLVDTAVALFGPVEAFDPYLIEWHRRTKADRPSGTAKELSRRILAAHPRKRRLAEPGRDGPPAADELELSVVRAGASPGMHLVGFDAPGETVELRLTARDRSAYAAGALAAAAWLLAEPRAPGLHRFDAVVDDLLAGARIQPMRPAA